MKTINKSLIEISRGSSSSSSSSSSSPGQIGGNAEKSWCLQFKRRILVLVAVALLVMSSVLVPLEAAYAPSKYSPSKMNAYATMLYMGTPRDYEFYVAARVMLQTLIHFKVDADLVVIASTDVPEKWRRTLRNEGVKVVVVDDIPNPYSDQGGFDMRFMFTLNKIYAWRLTEYKRVIMLDADNLFLQKTDELFQCGQFCAAFINPCIFHTGLFVLEPSNETFSTMMHDIQMKKENKDGADQGFLTNHFSDLLDRPMFHPPADSSRLNGLFRLPLGYQMDASYFYLKLKWNVPCGPNSVITFPSVPMLKPWYWWSWPTLPLGLSWHQKRVATIGYGSESPILAAEAVFFLITMFTAIVVRQRLATAEKMPMMKSCLEKGPCGEGRICHPSSLKLLVLIGMAGSFILPFLIIPTTVHPFMGWGVLLLGSGSLLTVIINVFQFPILPIMTPWLLSVGALLVLGSPFYSNGIVRALSIAGYIAFASPFAWCAVKAVIARVDQSAEREPLMAWTAVRTDPPSETLMKLC